MGANLHAWYNTRFGAFLQQYDLRSRVTCRVPIERVFAGRDDDVDRAETAADEPSDDTESSTPRLVLGLYFVPVSDDDDVKHLNVDVTEQLAELYRKLNDQRSGDDADHTRRYFEVIQVCFPQKHGHVASANENLKTKYENRLTAVPWFALPFDSVEKTIRLRHSYGIRDGEFALVLLDAATGQLITKHAYDRLLQDTDGVQFPWKSPHVLQILNAVPRYISLPNTTKIESPTCERPNDIELRPPPTSPPPSSSSFSFRDLRPKSIIGLYFSAYWCPPCKAFTSQLIKTYNAVRQRGHEFEVIFVSSDRSADSYEHYTSTMPWLAIPYEDSANRKKLTLLYGIQGIPTLILLNSDGSLITEDGRGEINDDPEGTNFPWFPKSVNILTPRLAGKLQKSPAVVLFIDGEEDGEIELAAAVLTPISEYVQKKLKDNLLFFVATDTDTTESIRDYLQLEDVSPLLTLIDISLGRFSVMEYGKEITEQTIMHFVHRFYDNELIFLPIER